MDRRPMFDGADPRDRLTARRYGVAASLVERATRCRLAGDWAGACAAAGVDVRFRLERVRRRHGIEVADELAMDLAHLAPDLLRWHLHDITPLPADPRLTRGLLAPGRRVVLARYGPLTLVAATPARLDRPQRIGLCCTRRDESRSRDDWTGARYLWDARAVPRLRQPGALLERFRPDLDLLRDGLISATELHPLVRAALFPDQPDPGYHPRPSPVDAQPSTVELSDVAIDCFGRPHRLGFRNSRLAALDHDPTELTRERVTGRLGGPVAPCVGVLDAWSEPGRGVLPEPLARLRAHALAAVDHGNTDEVERLLDAGMDPRAMANHAGGPLHQLSRVDGPRLLPRLLAAGLDINERNADGDTPLRRALTDRARYELLRALLDAGAEAGPGMMRLARRRRLAHAAGGRAWPPVR